MKNISIKETFNLEVRKLESFNFNCIKNQLQINNFEIKFQSNKIKDEIINISNLKPNILLKITKSIQFKIINKYSEKNKKKDIIENGLKNGKDIIYNNFKTNENKNFPINNNIKNNKYNKNNGGTKNLGNDGYMKNILLFITIILIVAFILNYINVYYFEIL